MDSKCLTERAERENIHRDLNREVHAPSDRHPSYADVVRNFKKYDVGERVYQQDLKFVKGSNRQEEVKFYVLDKKHKKIGEMHANAQKDADLWEYRNQIELKTWNFSGEQEHVARILMREYKKFVDAHKDVRCFIQIDSRDQKKIQLLEQEGWRRTQLVQQMDKGSLTRLLAEIHEQEPSTHIREAESFSEVRQQMADLHTLNASFNKQFTLASDGLQKFEQMYKETTNNNSGAWVVLKGDQQQTQGLMVLIKDGANNKIEVEAFIVAEELRTKPGMQNAGGNRPSHTLMREGLRIAQKKLGLNSETDVFLYVTEENQVAQKFYRKFDFRRIKELWDLPSSQDAPRDKLR